MTTIESTSQVLDQRGPPFTAARTSWPQWPSWPATAADPRGDRHDLRRLFSGRPITAGPCWRPPAPTWSCYRASMKNAAWPWPPPLQPAPLHRLRFRPLRPDPTPASTPPPPSMSGAPRSTRASGEASIAASWPASSTPWSASTTPTPPSPVPLGLNGLRVSEAATPHRGHGHGSAVTGCCISSVRATSPLSSHWCRAPPAPSISAVGERRDGPDPGPPRRSSPGPGVPPTAGCGA